MLPLPSEIDTRPTPGMLAHINPTPSAPLPVTVIITVFDRTGYLRGAIESVLAQHPSPAEIIVCDDSSSPSIRDICAPFAPQIEYRPNPHPLGVALSVRNAIQAAKYPLIAILNDDDTWEPNFLQTLVPPLLANPEPVLSFADHWLMDESSHIDPVATDRNTRRYARHHLPAGLQTNTPDLVLRRNAIPLAMAAVFRRDAIDCFRITPESAGAYDFLISCLLASTARPFFYSPARVSRYRIHPGMETARRHPSKTAPLVHILESLLRLNLFPTHRSLIRTQLARAHRAQARAHLRQGDKPAARQSFLASLKSRLTIKSALGYLLTFVPLRIHRILRN